MRIAVFASGRGSNLQAIHDAVLADKLQGVSLDLLVCDHPDAPVVKEVKKRGIPAFVFRPQDYPDKNSYETVISEKLKTAKIELVVLAGYMRLVGSVLLEQWEGRMINLHPSLLPFISWNRRDRTSLAGWCKKNRRHHTFCGCG